jgi:PadR family transcriptional regulator PadR
VPSDEGPHRKYYGVTKSGSTMLRTSAKEWGRIASTIDMLLAEAGESGGGRR